MIPPELTDTRRLTVFLRVYGVVMVVLFTFLFIAFMVEAPILAENGGSLNWLIWNDVRFGHDHAHVPPMLFVIFVVWGVFLLRAARNPRAYSSFLDFTIWASVAHGLLMIGQVATELERYWRSSSPTSLSFSSWPLESCCCDPERKAWRRALIP
jgi:hypothetical protein